MLADRIADFLSKEETLRMKRRKLSVLDWKVWKEIC